MIHRRHFFKAAAGCATLSLIPTTGAVASAEPGPKVSEKKSSTPLPGESFSLALGGGAAKALAHIPVIEAFDDLGIELQVIAGTSMGAIIGGLYASGMTGKEIRAYSIDLFEKRRSLFKRLFTGGSSTWSSLLSFSNPAIIDSRSLFEAVLPDVLPNTFAELPIPLRIVATDFHAQSQVVISDGPLLPAIAASSALPVLLTPVKLKGRVLIDGGFVNPTPFDVLRDASRYTVAVDVTASQSPGDGTVPGPLDTWIGAFQITLHSLVAEKLKRETPDLLIRPNVSAFGALDFYRIDEILNASEPTKELVKRGIEKLLAAE